MTQTVESFILNSSKADRAAALKFLERFDVDFIVEGDMFKIIDNNDGSIYHEFSFDENINNINAMVQACLNDCRYNADDDVSWVNTIESMKYFWSQT